MDYQRSSEMGYSPNLLILYLFSLLLFLFYIGNAYAKENDQYDLYQLDDRFRFIASESYHYFATSKISGIKKYTSVSELELAVKKYLEQDTPVLATSLLVLNLDLVKSNLDDRSILLFIYVLLENNEFNIAENLFEVIKSEGEKSIRSNVSNVFARYYFYRNQWQECLKYTENIYTDLQDNEASYAHLMTGVSLQNLKEHRKAIDSYEKIPASSKYYLYARLNIAVAYIRQGWWTDARNVIDHVLKTKKDTRNDEMINRLYLVLGYSLLQKEYFRDSREAFRNISTNSQYENRALLGIGLASANQGDYIGALNALSILKNKATLDLSVDESYLLFPFVYKKLGQQMTASTTYSEAIQYYQMRVNELDGLINKISSKSTNMIPVINDHEVVLGGNVIELDKTYPKEFLLNLYKISNIKEYLIASNNSRSKSIIKKLNKLYSEYEYAYKWIFIDMAKKRKENLNSYLNQSRYGLASLYDNDLPSDK